MAGFTEEEARQALVYASNDATFMFRASPNLCELVVKDSIETQDLPKSFKMMIMRRTWMALDVNIVIRYCLKKLDEKNKFILDNGDVKVVPISQNVSKKLTEEYLKGEGKNKEKYNGQ